MTDGAENKSGAESETVPDSGGSLFRSFVSVFTGRATVLVITIAFTPVLVRLLTPREFGVFATVMAMFTVVEAVGKGGLFSAIANQVAKFDPGDSEESDASLAGIALAAVYGVVITIVLAGAVGLSIVPETYELHLLVLASGLLVGNLFTAFQGVYYGRRQEWVAERVGVLWQLLYAVLAVALAVAMGLVGVFVGYVVAMFVATAVLWWTFTRDVEVTAGRIGRALRSQGRPIASFGAVQTLGGLAGILLHRTDILLVNYFRSVTESGIYRAALVPAEVIWFVPFVIQLSLLQNASSHWAKGDIDQIDTDTAGSFKYAFLALTLFGVGLFGLAEEFVVLYFGPAYASAATPLRILLVGAFLFGLSRAFTPTLKATGHNVATELVTGVGLVVNVVLNLLLIPRFGMTGAATGTAISYGVMLAGSLFVWRRTPFGFPSLRIVGVLCLHLLAFAVLYLPLIAIVPLGPLPSIVVGGVAGALLFLGLAVWMGLLSRSQLRVGATLASR
ncbi:oligosaccharide flippase family protein [Halapricum hydrolyticum]|uniref:Polysaccharide biosynthesis C-terminal domain-containing protein n=1 Tax=Halapricum hydrolyticum TaxID=2979991 RepID=A0AAE3IAU5_9EURY|nr:polysaccharide biosynthesis C-terminal domain-containing protein [Halapricum hydrolyticum]MCU4718205.1 polysaccharide biosynthesis C-terminal domain-containing protein [Halapricum hydrolyticum]MCU4726354.1 polysaccharide biosynthesis C-terminal domain-containing protein [Halapricum hydrolyticum]